jgi:hypothetical protein
MRAQFAIQAWENMCGVRATPKGLVASRWFYLCCDKRTA